MPAAAPPRSPAVPEPTAPADRDGDDGSLDDLARGLTVGGTSIVALIACMIVGAFSLADGGGPLLLVTLFAGSWFLAVLLWLARTRRVREASGAFLFGTTIAYLSALTVTGGLASPLVAWIPVYPVLFGVVDGKRGATAALGIATISVAGWTWLAWTGALPVPAGSTVVDLAHHGAYALVAALIVQLAVAGREHVVDVVRRQREAEARARADAEAELRAKRAMLATVSHELRTPVAGILGLLDVVHEGDLDHRQVRAVRTAQGTGRALLTVVEDLLDSSRLESGEIVLVDRVYAPATLFAQVSDLLEPSARQRGLRLTHKVHPEVPGALRGDAARIRQILVNLVGNAIKFTERGEVRAEATVDDRHLCFAVHDTGIGIPAEQVSAVFQPFVRAHADREIDGTGLGLSIVKLLVERMGGEIEVESILDRGTCFRVRLPLRVAQLGASVDEDPSLHETGPLRVLLVDDDPVTRQVFRAKLTALGHDVRSQSDGRGALGALAQEIPQLVLLDVQLPDLDGREVARRIRADRRLDGVVLLGLTADATPETRASCLASGYADVLVKPVSVHALRRRIAQVMASSGASAPATTAQRPRTPRPTTAP